MFNSTSKHVEGSQFEVNQGGVNNTTKIDNSTRVTINIAQPLSGDNLEKIIGSLAEANTENKYLVFICAPSDATCSDEGKKIFIDLTTALEANDIEYIVGGGKQFLAMQTPYHHINETDFLTDEKCNSLIVIADDHSTFSQLSLLSKVKHDIGSSSLEMYAVCKNDVIENQEFYRDGPISFFVDRVKGNLLTFNECGDQAILEIVNSISRHKLFWTSRRKRNG